MNALSQTRLPGHDEAEQLIGEFTLHEFRLLSKLSLDISVDCDGPVQKIDLVLTTNKRVPPARIHLRFSHVSGFKTTEWSGGVINIAGLDVVHISQNQMDGINWQVFDYEDSAINFYSREAEIVSVERIGRAQGQALNSE